MAVNVVPGTQDSFWSRSLFGSSSNNSGFPSHTGMPGLEVKPGYSTPFSRNARLDVGVMYISATGSGLLPPKDWLGELTVPVAIRIRMPS